MSEQKEKSNITTPVIAGVTGLVIGIAIGWGLLQTGTKTADIKWKFGQNELSINLDQDLTNMKTMLEKMFSERFSAIGALDWLKENKGLYSPNDPDLIKVFRELDYDELVCKELRTLSIGREGPWAYQFDTVRIGIPGGRQPKPEFAYACENGKYYAKTVKIFSLDQQNSIRVKASGRYECPKGLKFPDIQLNSSDAKKLLGRKNFDKYEEGIALILIE